MTPGYGVHEHLKAKALHYAARHGVIKAAELVRVHPRTIYKWLDDEGRRPIRTQRKKSNEEPLPTKRRDK